MSTDFRALKGIKAADMFDGGLELYGVREDLSEIGMPTDDRNCVCVYVKNGWQIGSMSNGTHLIAADRLKVFGVSECHLVNRLLTDGCNHLHVNITNGRVTSFTRNASHGDPNKILRFFADGAAKKWPLRGSLRRVAAVPITCLHDGRAEHSLSRLAGRQL